MGSEEICPTYVDSERRKRGERIYFSRHLPIVDQLVLRRVGGRWTMVRLNFVHGSWTRAMEARS